LDEPALNCPDFEDIAVEASGSVLAVGSHGAIYRFDEDATVRLDSPTNQHLSSITRSMDDRYFICGNNGVVLSIHGKIMTDLSVDVPPVRNLWAIEHHKGSTYVAEPARLLMFDGVTWQVEHVATNPIPTFYRLTSVGDELWSIGADHVFVKRGTTWTQLLVPGNEIPP
jgi:hypothetical protein